MVTGFFLCEMWCSGLTCNFNMFCIITNYPFSRVSINMRSQIDVRVKPLLMSVAIMHYAGLTDQAEGPPFLLIKSTVLAKFSG